MKSLYLFFSLTLCLACFFGKAQNVAINDNGVAPDTSAMLDISSNSKGILIPRMTTAQRNTIPSPAEGLMIYSVTDSSFYYYSNGWNRIGKSNEGWSLSGNAGTDPSKHFIGTTDAKPVNFRINNYNAGQLNSQTNNAAFGALSLDSITSGTGNTAIGTGTGKTTRTGSNNTFIGINANASNENINNSTAIGADAKVGQNNTIVLGKLGTKVGIGTSTPGSVALPSAALEIADETGSNADMQMRTAGGGFPLMNQLVSNGTLNNPADLTGNHITGGLQSGYFSGGSYKNASGLLFYSGVNPNGFSPGKLVLYTRQDSTLTNINTIILNEKGNVGINVNNPTAQLQLSNLTQNRKIVLFSDVDNDHNFYGLGISPSILRYQVSTTGNAHAFFAGTSSTSSVELMRISGNGNVGINNSTPQQKLDVAGKATIRDSLGIGISAPTAQLQLGNSTQNRKIVLYSDLNNDHKFFGFGISPSTLRYQVSSTISAHAFYAGTSNTTSIELMRINGNGNVGINNNNPQQKLDVAGKATIRDSLGIGISVPNAPLQFANTLQNRKVVLWQAANNDHQFMGLGVNSNEMRYQVSGVSDAHIFYAGSTATSSAELMRINGKGQVGIGTSNPITLLSNIDSNIIGTDNKGINNNSITWSMDQQGYVQAIYNKYTAGGSGNGLAIKTAGDSSTNILLDLSTGIQSHSGTSVMIVRGNGTVGIGTPFTKEKLTVNGAINISNGGYTSLADGDTLPVPAGGAGTIAFSNTHFFGWNGSQWKQLDN